MEISYTMHKSIADFLNSLFSAIFLTIACSLPPEPITKTFILYSLLLTDKLFHWLSLLVADRVALLGVAEGDNKADGGIKVAELAALFVWDRINHNINKANGINKMLKDGYTVISDRYYLYSS